MFITILILICCEVYLRLGAVKDVAYEQSDPTRLLFNQPTSSISGAVSVILTMRVITVCILLMGDAHVLAIGVTALGLISELVIYRPFGNRYDELRSYTLKQVWISVLLTTLSLGYHFSTLSGV